MISMAMASRIYCRTLSSSGSGGGSGPTETLIGPAVRNLLLQYGLKPTEVKLSGPRGNLVKGDILKQVSERNLQPLKLDATASAPSPKSSQLRITFTQDGTVPSPFTDLELTNMRRTIAKRLVQSKSNIPHAYGTTECNLGNILGLRKRMISEGLKVSVNDFIIKCAGNALGKCPNINVVWEGSQLISKGQIDISVAVATATGLITPIVSNVAEKDILEISENVRNLADKAKAGKLQPNEFMGGTFTISNLGMFGIHHFSAIINPPQCAILAVGGGQMAVGKSGKLETLINLTLSYDATGISEENVAKFLAHLKHEIENASETSVGIYNISSRAEIQDLLNSSSSSSSLLTK